jgi:predicted DCC family thiol-disulfide oxidoreductase YuxK
MRITNQPIVLFDGVCKLCSQSINFILKFDKKKQFRFIALQTEAGKKLVKKFAIPAETDSVILVYKNQAFIESDAAIKITCLLSFPWTIAIIFKILPLKFRNSIYRWIAKNRYNWFGKNNNCRIPSDKEKLFFPESIEF